MPSTPTVTETRSRVPDTPADIWRPAFPSPQMVGTAAALLPRRAKWAKGGSIPVAFTRATGETHHRLVVDETTDPAPAAAEGPRHRIVVAPGVLQVTTKDPARATRAAEQALVKRKARVLLATVEALLPDRLADARAIETALITLATEGALDWSEVEHAADQVQLLEAALDRLAHQAQIFPARITAWSRKSRANMRKVFGQLDYTPLYDVDDLGYSLALGYGRRALPAMVTLTYPGAWEEVAPNAKACKRHIDALKKRFRRTYGRNLVGVWKREFQRRGAPHYHLLVVPPVHRVEYDGHWWTFREWLSHVWAQIVGASAICEGLCASGDCGGRASGCSEYARHIAAGTGIDYREGTRCNDPARLATYFAKHGLFTEKDYQNDAPDGWADAGTVGRFWGVWGLSKALGIVEVEDRVALAASRTIRRWSRAQGRTVRVKAWRSTALPVIGWDPDTGEIHDRRWRKRWQTRRWHAMPGSLGFVVVKDGPVLASTIARYLMSVTVAPPGRSRTGPQGFLP